MDNSTVRRGLALLVILGCSFLLMWWFLPKGQGNGGWVVTQVRSGDAIVVERGGETHVVHLAGIGAPAEGECGFEASRDYLADGIGGVAVTLIDPGLPGGDNTWERYVEVQELDAGLAQIAESHAVALDMEHPRRDEYREADAATPDPCE